MRTALALLAAALGLSGCMTAVALAARPSSAVLAEMGRACARDAGLRWFGPRPAGLEVWSAGELAREPRTPAEAAAAAPLDYASGAEDLLHSGVAAVVYANLRPRSSGLYGLPPGADEGLYRLELRPWSEPACAAARAIASEVHAPPPADGRCVAATRVGGFDRRPHPNMVVEFIDTAADGRGYDRSGQVLFVDGAVRATSIRYSALKPGVSSEYAGTWGVRACQPADRRTLYEALRGLNPY